MPQLPLFRTAIVAVIVLILAQSVTAQMTWEPANEGLTGTTANVFLEAPQGALLLGTRRGISRLAPGSDRWERTYVSLSGIGMIVRGRNGDLLAGEFDAHLRSTDDGRTWRRTASSGVIAAASDGGIFIFRGSMKSTDEGATWVPSGLPTVEDALNLGGGRLVVITGLDSLHISSDSGRTWRAVEKVTYVHPRPLVAVDSMTVVRGDVTGIRRSTDAGATWRTVSSLRAWQFARGPRGEVVVASTADIAAPSDGLHRSTDGGLTWTQIFRGEATATTIRAAGEIWAASRPTVLRSTDDGGTWNRCERGLHERSATIWSAGAGVFFARAVGRRGRFQHGTVDLKDLYRTTDGGTSWHQLFDSVFATLTSPGSPVMTVSKLFETGDSNSPFVARLLVTSDRGTSWTTLGEGGAHALAGNDRGMLALVHGGGVRLSFDGGSSWSEIRPIPAFGSIAITPSGRLFFGIDGDTYRSIDSGQSWQKVFEGFEPRQFVVTSDEIILAYGIVDGPNRYSDVYITTNGGEEWWKRWFRGPPREMHFDAAGRGIVVSGFSNSYTDATTDGGLSWQFRDSLRQRPRTWLGANGDLYRYHEGRLITSYDYGATWMTLDTSLVDDEWNSAAADERYIIASTEIHGLFRIARPASVDARSSSHEPPISIAPVPASERIRVSTRATDRSVKVLDVHGTVVLEQTAREGWTGFDISHLPMGIYLVRVHGAGGSRTGRFVVAR